MGGFPTKLHSGTKTLDISGTESLQDQLVTADVMTAFLSRLSSNRGVKEICVRNCTLGTGDLRRLVRWVRGAEVNLRIDLSGVRLGVEGARALTPLLRQTPPRMHSLVLNDCCLGNAGAAEVCRGILDTELTLRNLELGSNGINSVGVEECSEVLRAGLLRGLSLFNNQLGPQSAGALTRGLVSVCRLTWLSLGHNSLGPEGCEALVKGLRHTGVLWLALGHNGIEDRGARALSLWLGDPSCELRSLGISHNQITDTGVYCILRALQSDHTSLRYLGLSHNCVSDQSCQGLAQLLRNRTASSVHYFTPQRHRNVSSSFDTSQDTFLPPTTPQHPVPLSCTLSKILLAGNLLTDFGVALLSGALAENSSLESLSLADNPFGDEGLICLAAALSPGNNLSLRSLDIQGSRVTPEAEARFVKMLADRKTPLKLGTPSLKERDIARPKSGPLTRAASKLSLRSHRLSFRRNKIEEFQV